MPKHRHKSRFALCAAILSMGCSDRLGVEAVLAPTDRTSVRFDVTMPLLSAVPWPNDALCAPQGEGRAPCYPNVSTYGVTPVIADWINEINATAGWSPTATISIPFRRGAQSLGGAAIDLESLLAAQQDSDFSNDAIYVIELETGRPVQLDFGKTLRSFVLNSPVSLDLADPLKDAASLLVDTVDERYDLASSRFDSARTTDGTTAGVPVYRTAWDRNSNGILDVPVYERGRHCQPSLDRSDESLSKLARCQADYLVSAYDSTAEKLRLFPRAPLREDAIYAVVLTNRLLDNGDPRRPILSPFDTPYHPAEKARARQVEAILSNPKLDHYYGEIAGTGLKNASYLWTFTTSHPTSELARLENSLRASDASQRNQNEVEGETALHRDCSDGRPRDTIVALLETLYELSPGEREAISDALSAVSAIRFGRFTHPTYLSHESGKHRVSELTEKTSPVEVPYLVTVPRNIDSSRPVSAVLVSHDVGKSRLDGLRFAGHLARFGLATILSDRFGARRNLSDAEIATLRAAAKTRCSSELLEALLAQRSDTSESSNYEGPLSVDLLSTRDIRRSSAVELLAFAQSFSRIAATSSNASSLALSIDGLLGEGEGGAITGLAATLPGAPKSIAVVDPTTSPNRAWARGADWSESTNTTLRVFGPRIFGVPSLALLSNQTGCKPTETSIRVATAYTGPNGREFGCLPQSTGGNTATVLGGTVIATNTNTNAVRCVALTEQGEFSLGIPANRGDEIAVSVFTGAELLPRFGRDDDCKPNAQVRASSHTFSTTLRDQSQTAQLAPLAPLGLGLERQSAEFRTAIDFAEAAFSLANTSTFLADLAQHTPGSDATGTLVVVSPGNPHVTPDEGLSLAVASGLVPNLPDEVLSRSPDEAINTTPTLLVSPPPSVEHPHPINYKTVEQALAVGHVAEGAPWLLRHDPEPNECRANRQIPDDSVGLCQPPCDSDSDCPRDTLCSAAHVCETRIFTAQECAQSLCDSDAIPGALSGTNVTVAPFPLRLGRYSGKPATKQAYELWQPRAMTASGEHPDWPIAALALPVGHPRGSHGIRTDDICEKFRLGTYVPQLIAHFISTRGRSYPPMMNWDEQGCLALPNAVDSCPFIQNQRR